MSVQSIATASAMNLLIAGIYYVGQRKKKSTPALLIQISGIVLSSLIHSSRPLTERHLKRWLEKRNIDPILGASSVLIMALTTKYTKASIATPLLLAILQIGAHKLSNRLFKEKLEMEARERNRNHPCKKSTFDKTLYLRTELFPSQDPLGDKASSSTAYLYALPDGFLVFVADNKGLPFFSNRMGSIDSSEVCKIQEEYIHRLTLSPEAIQRLKQLAKQVSFDGVPQEWELEDIPPFICIEGKWNSDLLPFKGSVNWEDLIARGNAQQHPAFELKILPATWETRPETPDLRGLSFNHSDTRFNIWVHEKNPNAFRCAQEELQVQITRFESLIRFIKEFEKASDAFNRIPIANIDLNRLRPWLALTKRSRFVFPHLKDWNSELIQLNNRQLCQRFRADKAGLIAQFREFFLTLPREAHFAGDAVLSDQFNGCFNEFQSSENDLVRNGVYINHEKLNDWLSMLRFASPYLQPRPLLDQLIANSQEYIDINNALRIHPANAEELQARRITLDPILQNGYTLFFRNYNNEMRAKGQFVRDLEAEIQARKDKEKKLHFFTLCEEGLGDFSVENYLKKDDGTLNIIHLNMWMKILGLSFFDLPRLDPQLLQDNREYLRNHARNNIRPITQEWHSLIERIITGYTNFFKNYVPALDPNQKKKFLKRLAQQTGCPRSNTESTAQIAYYSPLEQAELYAIIRRNRFRQVSKLSSAINTHLNELHNNRDLPEEFFNRFNEAYERAKNFIIESEENLNFLESSWGFDREGRLQIKHEEKSDLESEYTFDPCVSRNAQEISRLLTDITGKLSHLDFRKQSNTEAADLENSFLVKEVEQLENLYSIANEMLFLLNIPLRWNLHQQLHEYSLHTSKAKKLLAEGGDSNIYKRIGEGGTVLWDIVRGREESELSKRDEVHTSIYLH